MDTANLLNLIKIEKTSSLYWSNRKRKGCFIKLNFDWVVQNNSAKTFPSKSKIYRRCYFVFLYSSSIVLSLYIPGLFHTNKRHALIILIYRKQDRITLILWFKEDNSAPIYRFYSNLVTSAATLQQGCIRISESSRFHTLFSVSIPPTIVLCTIYSKIVPWYLWT